MPCPDAALTCCMAVVRLAAQEKSFSLADHSLNGCLYETCRKALRDKGAGGSKGAGSSFLHIGGVILVVLAAAVVLQRQRSAQARKSGYAVL